MLEKPDDILNVLNSCKSWSELVNSPITRIFLGNIKECFVLSFFTIFDTVVFLCVKIKNTVSLYGAIISLIVLSLADCLIGAFHYSLTGEAEPSNIELILLQILFLSILGAKFFSTLVSPLKGRDVRLKPIDLSEYKIPQKGGQ